MMRTQIATAALLALSAVGLAAGSPLAAATDPRNAGTDPRNAAADPRNAGTEPRNAAPSDGAARAETGPTTISGHALTRTADFLALRPDHLLRLELPPGTGPMLTEPPDGDVVRTATHTPLTTPADPDHLDVAAVAEAAATVAEPALAQARAATLVYVGTDGEEIDPARLRDWLANRDSPLAAYAEDLVRAGVAHDVDPRLVVGIAAIESSAGLALPPGSHNAWGWGGDGAHGLAAWPSWPDAIDTFTERLGALYDVDNVDETMAQRYCPPNWRHWLTTVRWVIQDI